PTAETPPATGDDFYLLWRTARCRLGARTGCQRLHCKAFGSRSVDGHSFFGRALLAAAPPLSQSDCGNAFTPCLNTTRYRWRSPSIRRFPLGLAHRVVSGIIKALLCVWLPMVQQQFLLAQTVRYKTQKGKIRIEGTSNIDDWQVESKNISGYL